MCPETQDREENNTLKNDRLEEDGVRGIKISLTFLNSSSGSKGRGARRLERVE